MNSLGVLLLLVSVCYGSVLEFLHAPDSVHLPRKAKVFAAQVPQITNSLMGFSAEKPEGWTGKGDVLRRPEAVAVFLVAAPDHTLPEMPNRGKYELMMDQRPDMEEVSEVLKANFADQDYTFLDISSKIEGTHADELSQISVEEVKVKSPLLADELGNFRAIARWLHTGKSGVNNGVPDVYVFRVNGLMPLMQKFGSGSQETATAVAALKTEIEEVMAALVKAYNGNCLIELVSSTGEEAIRVKRDNPTPTPTPTNPMNLYNFYGSNYPAAFNIVFLVSLMMGLTVLFVGVGMWFMDPGKDSIIYRMTMARAKKD